MNSFTSHKTNNIITALLLLLLHINALAQQSSNYFVTHKKEGWAIYSPTLNLSSTAQTSPSQPYRHLLQLGEQANNLWKHTKNKSDRITPFAELFETINRDFLLDIINEILSDERLLEKVTAASYRNVIGFLKIVLADGGPESWKIRLHVWEQKEQKEFPHNHKWDLYSKIISGYLSQDLYQITDTLEEGIIHSIREPISLMPKLADGSLPCPCRDNYELKAKECDLNAVSLRKVSTDTIGIGESYFMPNHLIHTITPGVGAISCVFTSAQKTDNSEVFVPKNRAEHDLSRHAPSVTKQELKEELIKIQTMLKQLHIQPPYLPELVDQRHRYFHPLEMQNMDKNWRKTITQSTKKQHVIQLTHEEKKQYQLTVNAHDNILINNQPINQDQEYIFVLKDNLMYATPKDFHHEKTSLICHTSFTNYGPIDSAGILHFNQDKKVNLIEAYSGHYAPSIEDMQPALVFLQSIGATTQDVKCIPYFDRKA